jgi:hypothetical protein
VEKDEETAVRGNMRSPLHTTEGSALLSRVSDLSIHVFSRDQAQPCHVLCPFEESFVVRPTV